MASAAALASCSAWRSPTAARHSCNLVTALVNSEASQQALDRQASINRWYDEPEYVAADIAESSSCQPVTPTIASTPSN
jgi:hypothetical protein